MPRQSHSTAGSSWISREQLDVVSEKPLEVWREIRTLIYAALGELEPEVVEKLGAVSVSSDDSGAGVWRIAEY